MHRDRDTSEWRVTSNELRKVLAIGGVLAAVATAGVAFATARAQLDSKADKASVDSLHRIARVITSRYAERLDVARETQSDVAAILRYLCTKATPAERRQTGMRCAP